MAKLVAGTTDGKYINLGELLISKRGNEYIKLDPKKLPPNWNGLLILQDPGRAEDWCDGPDIGDDPSWDISL